jgi:hypothetical protein
MATPLPPRDHKISRDDAIRITGARRRTDHGQGERSFAFHRMGVERVLNQPGCVGVRAYPAQHDDGTNTWVLVGVDDKGSDMVDGELAQEPFLCPPICPDENVLNGG